MDFLTSFSGMQLILNIFHIESLHILTRKEFSQILDLFLNESNESWNERPCVLAFYGPIFLARKYLPDPN